MKFIKLGLLILITSIFLASCGPKFEGTFSTSPEKPQAGDEITVMYDPTGTLLEGKDSIDMIAYLYSIDLDDAIGIEMKKEGKGFTATFSTFPNTRGVIVKFVQSDNYEVADNNNKEGYLLEIYDEDGNVVEGNKTGLATAYYLWGRDAGLERDGEKSILTFNKAFADNTDIKREYLENYFNILLRVKPDEANSIIQNELTELENKTDLTEKELSLLAKWYSKLEITNKADLYKSKVLDLYPDGDYAQELEFVPFNDAPTGTEKLNTYEVFKEKYPNSDKLSNMANSVIYTFAREGKFEEAYKFAKSNHASIHPFYYQYTVARMMEDNADSKLTMLFAEEGVEQSRRNVANPYTEKDPGQTIKEWDNSRTYYLGLNQFKYGELIYESGSVQKAIGILENAIENTDKLYNEQDLKNYYGKVLVDAGENQKALDEISKFIEEGNGSSELQSYLETAYVAVNGSEEGFDAYLSKYISAAEAEMQAELKGKMINAPAPAFNLTDLEGKEVSLSDYKGKTVVLDFWATWCGPCLSSFPGMQTAVEKYQDDESVAFLFVNTWERVDNKEENARNFIKENQYPFHVLLDLNNEVITNYKVEGIPTKFIVGPDQNIKFKSVGFSGNPDQMVKEIEIMIDLAKG